MRDMTVGELMDRLREYPAHWAVVPFIQGTEGVLTDVRSRPTGLANDPHGPDGPAVWIGEVDIPPHLQEAVIHRERQP